MTKTPTTPEGGRRQAKKVKPSGSAGAMASQTPARLKSESLGSGVDLLEAMLERENLLRAWERVKANKGAAGIDAARSRRRGSGSRRMVGASRGSNCEGVDIDRSQSGRLKSRNRMGVGGSWGSPLCSAG